MNLAVIQARMASTRLPGKALLSVGRAPLIVHVIRRGARIRGVDRVILATSAAPENDTLEEVARLEGIKVFRGEETNVLARFAAVAAQYDADHVVRLTGDNPLMDFEAVARLLEPHCAEKADYTCVTGLPTGAGADIFSRRGLADSMRDGDGARMADGVDLHILEHPDRFTIRHWVLAESRSRYRWSIDNREDLDRVQALFAAVGPEIETMTTPSIIAAIRKRGLESAMCPLLAEISPANAYTEKLLMRIPISAFEMLNLYDIEA